MNQAFKQGIFFTAIGKSCTLGTTLVVNAVLARLLTPNDYGVVAIVQVFILFFQMLVEAGMGPAVIQDKTLTKREVGHLFNFSVILAVLFALIFGFFGKVLVFFYQDSIYEKITWIQASAVFLTGVNVIPTAILNKEKRFKELNVNQMIASLLSGSVGIMFALLGYGVYALLYSAITLAGVLLWKNMRAARIKLVKGLGAAAIKKIFYFSIYQFSFNFMNYFSRNADSMLIGKFMGLTTLGSYSKAYQLLIMPNSILLGIINPVVQPVLSDYQDDVIAIRSYYLKIVQFLALIGFSLSSFLSLYARDIVLFMYGNQWEAAIQPFKILALTIWIQMTLTSTGVIFQARNKARDLFITGIYSSLILVGGSFLGILTGNLLHFAYVMSGAFIVNYIVSFQRVMVIALEDSLLSLFKILKIPFFIGAIEYGILAMFQSRVHLFTTPFIRLTVGGSLWIFLFLILVTSINYLKKSQKKGSKERIEK